MILGAIVIIVVGILVVNYFKNKSGETATGINTEATQKIHVVTKGETLWSIAESEFGSGYNWGDIYRANNLTSETIEVGQKLVMPSVASKEPTVTGKVAVSQENSNSIDTASYTVVRGDSLWKIAVRAYGDGYKWVEIAKANGLKNPNLIHARNVLSLPR